MLYKTGLNRLIELGDPLSSLPALVLKRQLYGHGETTGFRLGRSGFASDTTTYLQVT